MYSPSQCTGYLTPNPGALFMDLYFSIGIWCWQSKSLLWTTLDVIILWLLLPEFGHFKEIFSDNDFEASHMAEFHPASNTAVATASEVPPASVNTEVQGSPASSTADQVSAVPPELPRASLNS